MTTTDQQKLQMKDWKRINREGYLFYMKDYYIKNKGNGKWVNSPYPKPKPTPSKGWRDIKALERYKFPRIKPPNALPAERGWTAGRTTGTPNRPKCEIVGCEKKEGVFIVEFE
tara:strand:- start:3548 stop:3886 length:339 start_codon:yes stop_codon:yes gene_type:complete